MKCPSEGMITRRESWISVKEEYRILLLEIEWSLIKWTEFLLSTPSLRVIHPSPFSRMPEDVNTKVSFCLQPEDLSFSIRYLTVLPALGLRLYLSGCSFSSLYGPLHVSAPLCGCLCASKVDPANGLPKNP